jgi:hypothetical protein
MSPEGLQITSYKLSSQQDQAVGICLPGCHMFTLPMTAHGGVFLELRIGIKFNVLLCIFM